MDASEVRAAIRRAQEGWPRSFPVAQFPNPPLAIALAAIVTARLTEGRTSDVATAVSLAGLSIWAWEETTDGVNWFRRLLGVGGLVYVVARIAGEVG